MRPPAYSALYHCPWVALARMVRFLQVDPVAVDDQDAVCASAAGLSAAEVPAWAETPSEVLHPPRLMGRVSATMISTVVRYKFRMRLGWE